MSTPDVVADAAARRDPSWPERVEIYDTTLRDGSQREGLSLTVEDKLRIAQQLDELGVHYIEGGWPGANPKDDEFFARAPGELNLAHAELVAFGSTRRAGVAAEDDDVLRNLVKANTRTVCIVAKSWDYHVTEALNTSLDEAVAMVSDSVEFLKGKGLDVFLDAEHFFDGYKRNPEFSLRVLAAAVEAGADRLVLCDTNGGTLPHEVETIVSEVRAALPEGKIGGHFHNDAGCGVANALAAVRQGAVQVQGCMNGYGERTGNANLCSIIPNLTLKMGVETIPADRLARLTPISHHIAEIVNITPDPQQPYVGASAFAHKAGLHTSAIARASDAYEHVPADAVGNLTRFVVSELAGRSTVQLRAQELGIELDGRALAEVLETIKNLEYRGYHFEAADASFELLLRGSTGWRQDFFRLESFRVIMEKEADGEVRTEATIKLHAAGERLIATAEGNGPVNALDRALREAIGQAHPALADIHLTDYKVRVLDTHKATGAVTRVLIDSTDGERTWSTIGVSENIIEASWQALSDSIVYGLNSAESDRGE
ncbi:MAG TPA: citramalate synthase [Acidimicrobiia bacterium]|nr:citramalate synthase [Acidimicrobiia bacterium]